MKKNLFVFLGRTGCGKGAQTSRLSDYIKNKENSDAVFYVSTGDEFRKFMQTGTYSAIKTKEIVDSGNYVPSFLASMLWANAIARDYKENQHMIIDGSPRTLAEKAIFDTVFDFYGQVHVFGFEKVHVVFMNVSNSWATDKLLKRGRADDTNEAIANRMAWFESYIMPVIDAYKKDSRVSFHEINGEQSIEDVHADIVKAIGI